MNFYKLHFKSCSIGFPYSSDRSDPLVVIGVICQFWVSGPVCCHELLPIICKIYVNKGTRWLLIEAGGEPRANDGVPTRDFKSDGPSSC